MGEGGSADKYPILPQPTIMLPLNPLQEQLGVRELEYRQRSKGERGQAVEGTKGWGSTPPRPEIIGGLVGGVWGGLVPHAFLTPEGSAD